MLDANSASEELNVEKRDITVSISLLNDILSINI